ncbi:MAG: hypothetical protein KDD63_02930 [Bacteroidetes bacterium]|nr:hypothetical protein [Bacteroidota bacterium]MCB0842009.1 hypothetical protein [Bacteroidota bacterium]MCB0851172.1 hypothetical protein [Bacteroidota bacterium]
MNKISRILFFLVISFFSIIIPLEISAQAPTQTVEGFRVKDRSGNYHLEKNVPYQKNPEIRGDGIPTKMYVVQLARFEDLAHIPSTFPKGTFLWVSPDHPQEKLLLTGFYGTVEEAKQAALAWKKRPEFKGAFARATPFLIKYD